MPIDSVTRQDVAVAAIAEEHGKSSAAGREGGVVSVLRLGVERRNRRRMVELGFNAERPAEYRVDPTVKD
jgi:hypothetical protein